MPQSNAFGRDSLFEAGRYFERFTPELGVDMEPVGQWIVSSAAERTSPAVRGAYSTGAGWSLASWDVNPDAPITPNQNCTYYCTNDYVDTPPSGLDANDVVNPNSWQKFQLPSIPCARMEPLQAGTDDDLVPGGPASFANYQRCYPPDWLVDFWQETFGSGYFPIGGYITMIVPTDRMCLPANQIRAFARNEGVVAALGRYGYDTQALLDVVYNGYECFAFPPHCTVIGERFDPVKGKTIQIFADPDCASLSSCCGPDPSQISGISQASNPVPVNSGNN